jgi:peptidoglycan LD-endopeptidase LytH
MSDRRKIFWLWSFLLGGLLLAGAVRQLIVWTRPVSPVVKVEAEVAASVTPTGTPESFKDAPEDKNPATTTTANFPSGLNLIIPVSNLKPEQLRDTYNDARSAGRTHNAIDIMAEMGTPVVAAEAGEIARLFTSELGGITLYQFSPDRKVVFYYAHLSRYAEGIAAGRQVKQGEVIAYVGETGNVTPGNAHLHFAVWLVDDPKRYWNGINLNPYDLLKKGK